MAKNNSQKNNDKNLDAEQINEMLTEQTTTILGAVDEKLEHTEEQFRSEIDTLRNSIDK